MTTRSIASSSSRVGTPSSSSYSSSSEGDEAPSTQFRDLPHETIVVIGTKLRKPSDAFHFLLSCRRVQESGFFESCVPELIESRIGALRNVEQSKRAASAAQLAIGLGKRLGPQYLDRIIDKVDIPDESDLLFLLHREKMYVAAVVLAQAQAKDRDLVEAAGKELGAHPWNHELDGISHFLKGVRESLAGNERMICRCYAGLWQWYSKNEKNAMQVVDFALELLFVLKPAKGFVKLSVMMSMLESACLGPLWAKSPALRVALHETAKDLPVPKGKRSDRLFNGLTIAFGDCSDKRALKRQLELFSPLLTRKPGEHREAGITWLVQTIRQASEAGLGSKEIRKLVPGDVFLGKGWSYLIESATRGNFSAEVLDEIEHPSEHS